MIEEVIIVEGRDDIISVKAAVDAEVIATGGYSYGKKFINTLKEISKRKDIIILTDPDYAGENIRRDLAKHLPKAKHAYLPQGKALKKGNIGVENATKEDIIMALEKVRPTLVEKKITFTKDDLLQLGLIGSQSSSEKRDKLGNHLGIGHANGKQFLHRLNSLGVTKEEFIKAIEELKLDGQ